MKKTLIDPEIHAAQVTALADAHCRWVQANVPNRFSPMAVCEAHLKMAAAIALSAGLGVNETAALVAGFADSIRLEPGEPDPSRGFMQ